MSKENALVVLSGGQDSATCLFWAKNHYKNVSCITFDYGQRHRVEIEAAQIVAQMAGVPLIEHEVIFLGSDILKGTSPLTDENAVLEQYDDPFNLPGGLEKTFVPCRNLLFLTLAANRAYIKDADLITGVCQEDFGGYPDCRKVFIDALELTLKHGLDKEIKIVTPLMNLTKAETVAIAYADPACWKALAYTHTAYDAQYPPVGKDHATQLRAKGFIEANLPDPLILRAVKEGLMDLPETPNYDKKIIAKLELREKND